jgi:hypothetical protein
MATSYIVGRVENNEYGVAIAYSTVLIVGDAGRHRPASSLAGRPAAARPARHEPGLRPDCRRRMNSSNRKPPGNRVVFDKSVTKRYGTNGPRWTRSRLDFAAGHAGHAARPVRLRQDHHAAHDRRAGDATSGRILIGGRRRHQPAGRRQRDVSMVFQSYALFPHMTVLQNVSYGLQVSGF